MQSSFTRQDILDYLEGSGHEDYHFYIDFEHPYFFTAGSRLSLYADAHRWAIVFEKSGYSTGNSCAEIELAFFGNCLENLISKIPGNTDTSNLNTVILIHNNEFRQIEHDFELVARDRNSVNVRDTVIPIEQDRTKYLAKGIEREHFDNPDNLIDFPSLVRYLDEEYPALFRATDEELRSCLPNDLPRLMQIDHWHHRPFCQTPQMKSFMVFEMEALGEWPRDYETYPMIAEVLVSKDPTLWQPSLQPNNDWRNWPNAGYM